MAKNKIDSEAMEETMKTTTKESYMYVGDVVTAIELEGQEVMLAAGKTFEASGGHQEVARLLKQGLIVPYRLINDKHE